MGPPPPFLKGNGGTACSHLETKISWPPNTQTVHVGFKSRGELLWLPVPARMWRYRSGLIWLVFAWCWNRCISFVNYCQLHPNEDCWPFEWKQHHTWGHGVAVYWLTISVTGMMFVTASHQQCSAEHTHYIVLVGVSLVRMQFLSKGIPTLKQIHFSKCYMRI